MASRRRRPIVMRRDRKPPKVAVIIKKIVLIAAIVGVAHLMIVFFISHKEAIKQRFLSSSKETSKLSQKLFSNELPVDDLKESKKETVRDSAAVAKLESVELQMNNSLGNSALIETSKPVEEVTSFSEPRPLKKPIAKKEALYDVRKARRQISLQEMEEILNEISSKKIEANNSTNCIHLQVANNSNVENAVEITSYLRNNGYIIAGREAIAGEHRGVQIDATGTCINLVIGKF